MNCKAQLGSLTHITLPVKWGSDGAQPCEWGPSCGVVVRADYLAPLIYDTILVRITSKAHGITGVEVILDPAREAMSGLSKQLIDECLNSALGL